MPRAQVALPVAEHHVGSAEPAADYSRKIHFPVRGQVLSVYALEDPDNHADVLFCDVQLWDGYPLLHKVWVGRPHFHQETFEADPSQPVRRWRNAYPPWQRNGVAGWHASLLPGDMVIVQFVNGDIRMPFISASWPAGGQGTTEDQPHGGGFPFNQQARYRVTGAGLIEEVVKRLDATIDQAPQWTWLFNGAFLEITNDGSLLVQSSTNQEPFLPEDIPDQGLKQSPSPRGDIVHSTRGAASGNYVVTTGKSPALGNTNSEGNVVFLAYEADQGNFVVDTKGSGKGRIVMLASEPGNAQVFLQSGAGDYLHMKDQIAELSSDGEVVLRAPEVSLGSRVAANAITLWPQLYQMLLDQKRRFDNHTHPAPGSPPTPVQEPGYEEPNGRGPGWPVSEEPESKVVSADKDPVATSPFEAEVTGENFSQ